MTERVSSEYALHLKIVELEGRIKELDQQLDDASEVVNRAFEDGNDVNS